MDWWEAMRGRDRAREEADAERARQATREAQERGLDERARQVPPKQPEAIQRAENEPRPAERAWPSHAEQMRHAHDHPPEPKQPEQESEATRMEYTRTAQAAPSMGGAGVRFTNSRVQQPAKDFADELLEQAREVIAREEAAMTPEQRIERDLQRDLDFLERGRERTRDTDTKGKTFRGVWDSSSL